MREGKGKGKQQKQKQKTHTTIVISQPFLKPTISSLERTLILGTTKMRVSNTLKPAIYFIYSLYLFG